MCLPRPPPIASWARTISPAGSIPPKHANVDLSANSKPWATRSPSNPTPRSWSPAPITDPTRHPAGHRPPPPERAWSPKFRLRLPRPRHDHTHQKTTIPRTSRLGEKVQPRHQQNPLENRTNDREPEDLENPPHRLPPTTRNLHRHHQRRHRTTILSDRVNKPPCVAGSN